MRFIPFLLLLIAGLNLAAQTTVNYAYSDEELVNPERGFYRYTDTYSSAYISLTPNQLEEIRGEGKTLIFRYFILDGFLQNPISSAFLALMEQDFALLRAAGMKIIIRFTYTVTLADEPPYNDSPNKELLLQHIEQIAPIMQANKDVILTFQNGFWGVWGENYYSDEFGSEEDAPLTEENWLDRKEVTDLLLELLPEDLILSLRYPLLKSTFYEFDIPADSLTIEEAYSGTIKSRTGYHNDCFLVAANDFTFTDTETEKPYWETESRYTIMGGESCGDNPEYTNCENALTDLENAHWTYINDFYHPDVLDRWETEGCLPEIQKRLGYRLFLNSGTFAELANPGGVFDFSLNLTNEGFAAPVNARFPVLIFQNDSFEYAIQLQEDMRKWYGGGNYVPNFSINLPEDMEPGVYDLFLHLPDLDSELQSDPRYAIQLANEDIWDPTTAYHDLMTSVMVSPISSDNNVELTKACYFEIHQNGLKSFSITKESVSGTVSIMDITGKVLLQQPITDSRTELNLEYFPTGLYILKIRDEKDGFKAKRFFL